ncbi:RAQPRD family integrative conjugative element protein [uncultured Vibrio sp.]|uniref:integrative conjugative element protein, RAQPRD family n=1 Tax=uncultured Vibrio sp. TaxID=114054 RepID=UPI00262170FF|nr:RAQPRD family integrative conjugative element protein [uncultured Vibrio sp.]
MKWSLLLCLSLLSSYLYADVETEQRELALVASQLGTLDYLITRAEREADYRSARQFDYDALRLDIRTLQAGIDAYLRPERRAPKPLPPLGGDYVMDTPHE